MKAGQSGLHPLELTGKSGKFKLLAAEDIDSMDIKVDTDNNGVVVLSGTAKTKAESDRAHNIAHSVDGVRKVINRIEVGKGN